MLTCSRVTEIVESDVSTAVKIRDLLGCDVVLYCTASQPTRRWPEQRSVS